MSTSDIADRYRRLADRFDRVAAAVPDDAWDNPSPCEGWTAADVVRHVADTERELVGRLGLADVPEPEPDLHPREAWREIRPVVEALLDDPTTAGHTYDGHFGPTTLAQTIDTFYCLDLLVHGWDLARAAGLADLEAMPADEVTASFEAMRPFSETLRTPGVCGPELEPPAGADEQTRFLAFLGRRV